MNDFGHYGRIVAKMTKRSGKHRSECPRASEARWPAQPASRLAQCPEISGATGEIIPQAKKPKTLPCADLRLFGALRSVLY
jgi:hypothetical protein